MYRFTERQVLQMLSTILSASAFGFRSEVAQDAFDKELVCVHILQPGFKIPDPLLELKNSYCSKIPQNLHTYARILLCKKDSNDRHRFKPAIQSIMKWFHHFDWIKLNLKPWKKGKKVEIN